VEPTKAAGKEGAVAGKAEGGGNTA
jgi:hypothetical protein